MPRLARRFKAPLSPDLKQIWRVAGVHNRDMIRQLEMHVYRFEDCVLYHCTPSYSQGQELVSIQITSRRRLGIDLDVQKRLRRLHASFTTRTLEKACSTARSQIIEDCLYDAEVYYEVGFRGPKVQER